MLTRRFVLAAPAAALAGPPEVAEAPSPLAEAIARYRDAVAAGDVPTALERELAEIPVTTDADAAIAGDFVASWCTCHCNDYCVAALAGSTAAFLKKKGLA